MSIPKSLTISLGIAALLFACVVSYQLGHKSGVREERACWIAVGSTPDGLVIAKRDPWHSVLSAVVDVRPHGLLNIVDRPYPAH